MSRVMISAAFNAMVLNAEKARCNNKDALMQTRLTYSAAVDPLSDFPPRFPVGKTVKDDIIE